MMAAHPSAIEKDQQYKEQFLSTLAQRVSEPTDEWPCARWWTKRSFNRLCSEIRDELKTDGIQQRISFKSILSWLRDLNLATPLIVEGEHFYLLEFGASENISGEPNELLTAANPSGTICYFSAIAYHDLTTQHVSHHHIANLMSSQADKKETETRRRKPRKKRNKSFLGTLMFQYQGIPYYSTRRSRRLVPGVQTRAYGPRSRIHITTFEQTLLDTLFKPIHCGGPEVVFEAWQSALDKNELDEQRMAEHLDSMQFPAIIRRTAVMFEIAGVRPGKKLGDLFKRCRDTMDRESPFAAISLLPGIAFPTLNHEWMIKTP